MKTESKKEQKRKKWITSKRKLFRWITKRAIIIKRGQNENVNAIAKKQIKKEKHLKSFNSRIYTWNKKRI